MRWLGAQFPYLSANLDFSGDGALAGLFTGDILPSSGRLFTIWDSNGNLVHDSGDDFEQITANLLSPWFNASNDDNEAESRSDAKGPEPEAVTTGVIDGRTYAFVGLERIGGIMVYDVTDPTAPSFVTYVNNRDFTADPESPEAGDLGPEDLVFIAAENSPTGRPMLAAANEISCTVTFYSVDLTRPVIEIERKGINSDATARRDGDLIQIVGRKGEIIHEQPLSSMISLTVAAEKPDWQNIALTIDFEHGGAFAFEEGLTFEGGDGWFDADALIFKDGNEGTAVLVNGEQLKLGGLVVSISDVEYGAFHGGGGDDSYSFEGEMPFRKAIVVDDSGDDTYTINADDAGDAGRRNWFGLPEISIVDYHGDDTYQIGASDGDIAINDRHGWNTLDFSATDEGIRFDLGRGGRQRIGGDATLRIHPNSFEQLIGTEHDDRLTGGRLDEIIRGLGGNDRIDGEHGDDVLIGGLGEDDLDGDRGDDILIGGSTVYDDDMAALKALSAFWQSRRPLNSRVDGLLNGVPAIPLLPLLRPNIEVIDDGEDDSLDGGRDDDWAPLTDRKIKKIERVG